MSGGGGNVVIKRAVMVLLAFVAVSAWADEIHNGVNGWTWTTTVVTMTDETKYYFIQT